MGCAVGLGSCRLVAQMPFSTALGREPADGGGWRRMAADGATGSQGQLPEGWRPRQGADFLRRADKGV